MSGVYDKTDFLGQEQVHGEDLTLAHLSRGRGGMYVGVVFQELSQLYNLVSSQVVERTGL